MVSVFLLRSQTSFFSHESPFHFLCCNIRSTGHKEEAASGMRQEERVGSFFMLITLAQSVELLARAYREHAERGFHEL
jgi:hypothetical protein